MNTESFITINNPYSILQNLSKSAHWFLWSLVKSFDSKTNVSTYIATGLSESQRITRAYKELDNKSIVKRIQKQTYIINPGVIKLANTDPDCKHDWLQLSFPCDNVYLWCRICGTLCINNYNFITGEYAHTFYKTPKRVS